MATLEPIVTTQGGRHERSFGPARGPLGPGQLGPSPMEKRAGPSCRIWPESLSVRSGLSPSQLAGPRNRSIGMAGAWREHGGGMVSIEWGVAGACERHGGGVAGAWRGCGECVATQAWRGRKKLSPFMSAAAGAVVRVATRLAGPGNYVHWTRPTRICRMHKQKRCGRTCIAASGIVFLISGHRPSCQIRRR